MKGKSIEDSNPKSLRPWSESLSAPLAGKIFGNLSSKLWTKLLPIIDSFVVLLAALFLYSGFLLFVPFIYYISKVLDDADGMVSRNTYGEDPEWRGTLDFVSDHAAAIPMYVAAFLYLPERGRWLLFVYLVVSKFYGSLTSTKFRLYAVRGRIESVERNITASSPNLLAQLWFKLKSIFSSRDFVAYPTIDDASFLIWAVGPFLNFHWLIFLLAILAIIPQMVCEYILPIPFLSRGKQGE